jgi:hypothetical protein
MTGEAGCAGTLQSAASAWIHIESESLVSKLTRWHALAHTLAYVCAVSESITSNIALAVVSSSCAEAIDAFDADQYERNIISRASSRGVSLTNAQVRAVIADCRTSSRRLSGESRRDGASARHADVADVIVELLVTISDITNSEQVGVRDTCGWHVRVTVGRVKTHSGRDTSVMVSVRCARSMLCRSPTEVSLRRR